MAQEIRHELDKLAVSEGWKYIVKMLESQLRFIDNDLQAASSGMDGLIGKEYLTGERAGIVMALGMPNLQLAGINETIEALTEDLENDDENT